jgi:hypothetical protein
MEETLKFNAYFMFLFFFFVCVGSSGCSQTHDPFASSFCLVDYQVFFGGPGD